MSAPRPCRLDPFLDRVGVISDREMAEIAGVSPEAVRAYRARHGIPAKWREKAPEAE